jgi:hypothetical protein
VFVEQDETPLDRAQRQVIEAEARVAAPLLVSVPLAQFVGRTSAAQSQVP